MAERQTAPSRGPNDVDAGKLGALLVVFIGAAVVLHLAVWLLFDLLAASMGNPPVGIVDRAQLPPPPRLLPHPVDERLTLESHWRKARTPVEAALTQVLQHPPPVRAIPADDRPLPGRTPGVGGGFEHP